MYFHIRKQCSDSEITHNLDMYLPRLHTVECVEAILWNILYLSNGMGHLVKYKQCSYLRQGPRLTLLFINLSWVILTEWINILKPNSCRNSKQNPPPPTSAVYVEIGLDTGNSFNCSLRESFLMTMSHDKRWEKGGFINCSGKLCSHWLAEWTDDVVPISPIFCWAYSHQSLLEFFQHDPHQFPFSPSKDRSPV